MLDPHTAMLDQKKFDCYAYTYTSDKQFQQDNITSIALMQIFIVLDVEKIAKLKWIEDLMQDFSLNTFKAATLSLSFLL